MLGAREMRSPSSDRGEMRWIAPSANASRAGVWSKPGEELANLGESGNAPRKMGHAQQLTADQLVQQARGAANRRRVSGARKRSRAAFACRGTFDFTLFFGKSFA